MCTRTILLLAAILLSSQAASAQEEKLAAPLAGTATVRGLAITPDGKTAVVGFLDTLSDSIRLWDLSTGKETTKLPTGSIFDMALSSDGATLALSTGKTAELWDIKTAKKLVQIDAGEKKFHRIALAADGKQLATSNSDEKVVRVWDLPSGKSLRTIGGREQEVHGVAFSPDGKLLASADFDGLKFHSAERGELIRKVETSALPTLFRFSPDGKRVAHGSGPINKNLVYIVDAETGKTVLSLGGHTSSVTSTAWSPDGKLLASGGSDNRSPVKLWDAATGKLVAEFKWENPEKSDIYDSPLVAFTPDGKRVVAAGGRLGLRVWTVPAK